MEILKKFWLLWAALGAIGVGFWCLSAGKLAVGPVALVAGYCVLLPFFLWRAFRRRVTDFE